MTNRSSDAMQTLLFELTEKIDGKDLLHFLKIQGQNFIFHFQGPKCQMPYKFKDESEYLP